MKIYLATGIVGLAAASAYFMLTTGDRTSSNIDVPTLSQADVKTQLFEALPMRRVEASEAEMAMARLGLWEPTETVTWDSRMGENGNYVFVNYTENLEDQTFSVAKMELSGVRLLEGHRVYFDAVEAVDVSIISDDETINIGDIGIKLPSEQAFIDSVTEQDPETDTPLREYVGEMMEPGYLSEFPQILVENLSVIEKDEVWDVNKTADVYEQLESTKNNRKEVINSTRLDFASVTKQDGQDGYQLQLSNFVRDDHTYYGDKKKTELRTLSVSGLDPEIREKLGERFEGLGLHNKAGTMFEPLFLSLDMEGFRIESEIDIIRVDQATVRHSDIRGNQFTRRIDVPQIYVAKKSQPGTNADNEFVKYNPIHTVLDQFGYEDVTISVSSQTSYDKINKSVSEDGARLSISDAVEFNLAYKVNNISNFTDIFEGRFDDNGSEKKDLPAIQFGQFSVTDRGLNERTFSKMAEDQDLTVEEIKQAMKGSAIFAKTIAKSDYQKNLAQSFIEAYSAFTDNGGKFQINMRPQRPIYFTEYFGLGESIADASAAQYEEDISETEELSSEDFSTSDEFTDDVTLALQNDAMDNLLREMNISFEYY